MTAEETKQYMISHIKKMQLSVVMAGVFSGDTKESAIAFHSLGELAKVLEQIDVAKNEEENTELIKAHLLVGREELIMNNPELRDLENPFD